MDILFIHPYNIEFPGGGETWISEVTTRLKERGHNIHILHTKYNFLHNLRGISKKLEKCGIKTETCSYVKLIRGFPLLDPLILSKRLDDYEIAYFMAYPPNEIIISLLKKIKRIPIISGFHTMINPEHSMLHKFYSPLYFKLYRNFDALHVLNEWTYAVFVRKYHVESRKVFFIPNGIDVSSYSLEDNPEGKFVVLFTGRLETDKGADILCKLITEFNNSHCKLMNDLEFMIAGTGSYKDIISRLSERYNNVKYLGFISEEDLRKVYAQSSVYLITSRSEGMPIRALEAMASGLPIIGSNIPGLRDLVKNENLGRLMKVGEIIEILKAIIYYYSLWKKSPEGYFKLRKTIRSYAIENYDWKKIILRIEGMFYSVKGM
ncbi:MAG: glycosyltransferase family 4 protein [Nitrososphaeria archaeon]